MTLEFGPWERGVTPGIADLDRCIALSVPPKICLIYLVDFKFISAVTVTTVAGMAHVMLLHHI